MSGQLVGEVLDAAEGGHLDKLSRPAFAALLAIAERCHHLTRQGTVRQARIQAAIHACNSTRTTERAIRELKDAGFVRIVKRGYRLPTGEANSSIYELSTLPPSKVAETSAKHPPSKVAETIGDASAKTGHASAKTGHASATLDGGIDGSIDGSIDGEGLRQSGTSLDEPHPSNNPPPQKPFTEQQPGDPEPPPFCPRHPDGTYDNCRACGQARLNHDAWKTRDNERAAERRAAIRQAIDACHECDDYGRPFAGPLPHCPNHPNFRQLAEQAAPKPAGANTDHGVGINPIGHYITAIGEAKRVD